MILRLLISVVIGSLWVGPSLQSGFFDPYIKIRWCRSRVRSCSKNSFNTLVLARIRPTLPPTTPGPDVAPPAARRKRLAEPIVIMPLESMYSSEESKMRIKREDPPAGGVTEAGAAAVTPAGTTSLPDYPDNVAMQPTPAYKNDELEDTFYVCLDKLGKDLCFEYMWQKCNWHDGSSPIISKYCKKWGIPCKPCDNKG